MEVLETELNSNMDFAQSCIGTEKARLEVLSYFKGINSKIKKTDVGLFDPSRLEVVKRGLDNLIFEGLIDTNRYFIDAGSGDGRIVALCSAYDIPCIGVEFDSELVKQSRKHIQNLSGLFNKSPLIIGGDFTKDETYKEIAFEEVGTFYNYFNGYLKLSRMISEKSPKGTRLILYGNSHRLGHLYGLNLERTLRSEIDDLCIHVCKK